MTESKPKIKIGLKVRANHKSVYSGLTGEITEIKKGKNKETDNVGDDIYVRFDYPKDIKFIKVLEHRVSSLHGKIMNLDDIDLEEVIMSLEMLDIIHVVEDKAEVKRKIDTVSEEE